ncbi:MAG: DUF2206 domain-containing protein [Chloroflexi bacterium]|nr:DUF2206 domain-containing protein [Chloroflexota bacterium]
MRNAAGIIAPLRSAGPLRLAIIVAGLLLAMNAAVLLDVPVLRQVLSFFFLTFIPGALLLVILRLHRLGLAEKIVLSLGLSVSFWLFFALAMNALSLAVGYTRFLSQTPLLIASNVATVALTTLACKRGKGLAFSLSGFGLSVREKALLVVPALLPLLSILGMRVMNVTDNNMILLAMYLLIAGFVIFVSTYHGVSERLYPASLYLISFALLIVLAFRSNHLVGSDTHTEFYFFQRTIENMHWKVLGPDMLDAALSITLLPAIYQSFLSINPEYLFKVMFSLFFSISPLAVYVIARKYIGGRYAFIAAFFFMAQFTFVWAAGNARTIMAIMFFALAIMALFKEGISGPARKLLFIVFAASVIVAHYSTAYIFLFVLMVVVAGMQALPGALARLRRPVVSASGVDGQEILLPRRRGLQVWPPRGITVTLVALLFAVAFFWYGQVTLAAFGASVSVLMDALFSLNQSFSPQAKGASVTAAAGAGITVAPQYVRMVVSWLAILFIAVGSLGTLSRYERMVRLPGSDNAKPGYLRSRFDIEYLFLGLAGCAILVLLVVLPWVSVQYDMERTFFQLMVVLSVFFVIGGVMLARLFRTRWQWIVLPVMVLFFLSTTGVTYQLSGYPASLTLNSQGREYELWYVHDQESHAARWLKVNGEDNSRIFTDVGLGERLLPSQGGIDRSRVVGSFAALHKAGEYIDGYVYLSYLNIAMKKAVLRGYRTVDVTEVPGYAEALAGKSRIYVTNGSEIYR